MGKQTFRRWRAGFTLAEVMVVVALIVVLAAIAIPSVMVLRKNLKIAELDSCAKDIFIAAQNSLTGLKSSGSLILLKDSTPTDAPEGDLESDTVCYLTQSSPAMGSLLPTGAIDGTVAANDYVIVFDAASATVLDVYYSEASLSAEEAIALRNDPDRRRNLMMGYYGGSNVVSEPSITKDLPTPILTLDNAEDLTAKVTLDLSRLDAETISQLNLTLTLSDGTESQDLSFGVLNITGGSSYSLVLDSLTGPHFKTLCPSLSPGADITATATLAYNGPNDTYLPAKSASTSANSLFASRNAETVNISYPRHLQNLDSITSGVLPQITSAVLERSIDWPETSTLVPIENAALLSFDGNENMISGLKILPRTSAQNSPAGLFGRLGGTKPIALTNIRIENATLTNTTGGPSGLLAGNASNIVIDNCFVYVVNNKPYTELSSAYAVSGSGDLGGLIGYAEECTISYSMAGLPVLNSASNTSHVGGLIGRAVNCPSVRFCYASIDQLAGNAIQAAMLIGRAENVPIISNCYTAGNIQVVTPLAKNTGDIKVSQISGFMNNNPAAKVSDCYTAATYLDEKGKNRDITIMYSFAPERESSKGGAMTNCAYLTTSVKVYNTVTQEGNATEYSKLAKWRGTGFSNSTDLKTSFPYRDSLHGKYYPFPLLTDQAGDPVPHYGSWPSKPKLSALGSGLAYIEQYEDGSYGCYSVDQNGTVWNSLRDDLEIIVENSNAEKALPTYGILLDEAVSLESLGDVSFGNFNNATTDSADKVFYSGTGTTVELDGKVFYPLKNDIIRDMEKYINDNPQFSCKFIFKSNPSLLFYVNPNLAAAVATSLDAVGSPWSEAHPLQVRTDEQLAYACAQPGDYTHFLQTHDIDASYMEDTSSNQVTDSKYFDGNNYKITGLRNPLFGSVTSATIKNVTIEDANIQAYKHTGIFAQRLDGKSGVSILNCKVVNSSIASGSANVAGFSYYVGALCTVENSSVTGTEVTSTSGSAAGFACDSAGKIINSHSLADVSGGTAAGFVYNGQTGISNSYFNGSVKGSTSAAGFVYNCAYGTSKIENCYAVGALTAPTSYGFAAHYHTPFANSYAAMQLNGSTLYGFTQNNGYPFGTIYYMEQSNLTSQSQAGEAIASVDGWMSLSNKLGSTIWQTSSSGFPALKSNPHIGAWPTPPEVTP